MRFGQGNSPRPTPSKELLDDVLIYSIVEGSLFWKTPSRFVLPRNNHSGKLAGQRKAKDIGPVLVTLMGVRWRAHRLIWCMVTGEDPGLNEIDHADGNEGNNTWLNLRIATRSEQLANRARHRNNRSGVKGVSPVKHDKWRATITFNGETVSLGTFTDFDDAVAARLAAEASIHGEFHAKGRGNVRG